LVLWNKSKLLASISQMSSVMKSKHVNMTTINYFSIISIHGVKYMFTTNTIFDQHNPRFLHHQKRSQKSRFFRISMLDFGLGKPTFHRHFVVTNIDRGRFLSCTGRSALSCVRQAKAARISPIRLFFRPCGDTMTRRKTLIRARSLTHRQPPSLMG
jgi:hypothetical protein